MFDEYKQNKISDTKKNLNDKQILAAKLLVSGKTIKSIAKEVGVARETVSRWKNNNYYFKSYANHLRNIVIERHADLIRFIAQKAIKIIKDELEKGNVKVAMKLLDKINLFENEEILSINETDPEVISGNEYKEGFIKRSKINRYFKRLGKDHPMEEDKDKDDDDDDK